MSKHISSATRRDFCKVLGVGAVTTAFLSQNTLSAYAASNQKEIESRSSGVGINVLLVHGAFADASSWSKVITSLQDKGYNVLAVQKSNVIFTR